MEEPRISYERLMAERRVEVAAQERRQKRLGYVRLAVVGVAAVLVWAALALQAFSIAWVLLPIAVFAALMVWHDRLGRTLEHRRRAVIYFEHALQRLDGKWAGHGEPGDRYLDPAHPYAVDLDLFGQGS